MGFGRILNVVSGLLSVQDLGLYQLLCVRFFSQIHFLCVLIDFGFFYCAFLCWWLCLPRMVRLGFFYFWCCIYFWSLRGYKTRSRKPNPLSIKQATPNKTHGGG
eukprot:TRINITY_DN30957_c0_g1_i1.p1 TRINITY_DN30957_c0_g1~~TRINITY_DN30957_c0_g1_i1.p1  ORF type:complete len:104 (-),score=1.44 TRINITY_DN30957_c0_g1_i1:847-1158(-)